jgi:hypothetical protein
MLLTLIKADISLSNGVLNVAKSPVAPYDPQISSLSQDDNTKEPVKIYKKKSTFFVEAERSSINFKLNIDSLQHPNIEINIGKTDSTERISMDALTENMGIIQLVVKKEEVGDLHLCVNAGAIIIVPRKSKITPFGEYGYETHFKGELEGQKTSVLVNIGTIVCMIL